MQFDPQSKRRFLGLCTLSSLTPIYIHSFIVYWSGEKKLLPLSQRWVQSHLMVISVKLCVRFICVQAKMLCEHTFYCRVCIIT